MHSSTSNRAERITRRNARRIAQGKCPFCMRCDRYGRNGRKNKETK